MNQKDYEIKILIDLLEDAEFWILNHTTIDNCPYLVDRIKKEIERIKKQNKRNLNNIIYL